MHRRRNVERLGGGVGGRGVSVRLHELCKKPVHIHFYHLCQKPSRLSFFFFFLLAHDRTDVRHMRAMFCKLVRLTMITVVCAVLGSGDVYSNCIVMETCIIIN